MSYHPLPASSCSHIAPFLQLLLPVQNSAMILQAALSHKRQLALTRPCSSSEQHSGTQRHSYSHLSVAHLVSGLDCLSCSLMYCFAYLYCRSC